jgi:disulfide bond formation protein DsbB
MNDATTDTTRPDWMLLFATWLLATGATLTSLFLSEIVQIPICDLCWYQRIFMYPLVPILALGLFPHDPKVVRYALVLVAMGWLTALFHLLLIAGLIPEAAQPCVQGVPCSETHVALFGFLNIPTMSLLTFTILGILLLWAQNQTNRDYNG